MNAATYGNLMRIIAVILAALVAVAIVLELPLYVPLIAVMVSLVISSILRRRVKDVMVDERNQRIYERATGMTYRVFTIAGAGASLVAMMLRSSLPEWAFIAGETLAYAISTLMLIHLAFSNYYQNRL